MKKKTLLLLLCLLFLALALYSAVQLFLAWQEYSVSDKVYNDLSQFIQIEGTTPPEQNVPQTDPTESTAPHGTTAPTQQETNPEDTAPTTQPAQTEPVEDAIVWPVVDFESLRKINPDVVAWIYIQGTNINYPVVQGWDNDYYLYHLFDNTYNKAGSIFMDYRNDYRLSDTNTVLHGHHMRNQSMFAQITGYTNQSFYDEHPYAMLLTPDGNYLVEFFSGYVADAYGSSWKMRFSSDSEYATWLNETAQKSHFASNVVPTVSDQVVTLSTCTYEYDNARFVVHGILRSAESLDH